MVFGSISPTLTPPEVMIAFSTGIGALTLTVQRFKSVRMVSRWARVMSCTFFVRRDARAVDELIDHFLRQKRAEHVAVVAVCVLFKIRQQALVEHLLVERGLEVDLQSVLLFVEMPHVRAGRQDERPAHAEVREQHFAEIRVNLFVVFVYRQRNVAQAQPLQHRAFACLERHE